MDLSELAIVACDLAEVLGAAIGLNLLFKIPILIGVVLTALDTLLILWFARYGIRMIEACVIVLIATIGGCFMFEIFLAKPNGRTCPRADSQYQFSELVHCGRNSWRHRHAPQSVLAFGAGANEANRRDAGRDSESRAGSIFWIPCSR